MKYMEIGKSGIRSSVITFGAMGIGGGTWWRNSDDEESIQTLHKAFEMGINTVDTAPVYGFGHSEEVLGRVVKGRRSDVIISTKCGLWWGDGEGSFRWVKDGHRVSRNLSARTIRIELENSLRRLGTDYIDIYYTHNPCCPPFMTPVEETVGLLMDFKKEGKIRAIGASNMTPQEILDYTACGEIDIIQGRYSMLTRGPEDGILQLCREKGMSFHAYMPLERGLLTGKVTKDYVVPEGDARDGDPWWSAEKFPRALEFVEELKGIAGKYNCQLSQLALAYLRGQGGDINVICGARRVSQIAETALAADLVLEKEDLDQIRKMADQLQ